MANPEITESLSEEWLASLSPLITHLADGETHSGEELGRLLGISRTAVWKQLKKLSSLGLEVDSVKGSGYRLIEPLDLLDATFVRAELIKQHELAVTVVPCIDSTNSSMARFLRDQPADASGASLLAAEMQTQGRGRRGRSWVSPFAGNLYFSLGVKTSESLGHYEGISLAMGVEIAETLSSLIGDVDVRLKWPNDILVNGKKLAGILIEVDGDFSGHCNLVLGVGINCRMSTRSATAIDQPWTDLTQIAQSVGLDAPGRSQVLVAVANRLLTLIADYPRSGFAQYQSRWQALDEYYGQPVTVTAGANICHGVSAGVDDTGALILDLDNDKGTHTFSGGEVTLRSRS